MSTDIPRMMVLNHPEWQIAALYVEKPRLSKVAALAISDRGRIVATSSGAREAGVSVGLRHREAVSRCPQLIVEPADPSRDARGFEPVLTRVESAFPAVALLRPGECAVSAAGPDIHYGAERAAALVLLRIFGHEQRTVPASVGVADGLFAARVAARAATPGTVEIVPEGGATRFLAPLPIALLGEENATALMTRLGIRTLGDFAALPLAEVTDRFGAIGESWHRKASGLDDRRVVMREPPEDLSGGLCFDPPLELAEQIAFAARLEAERFLAEHTKRMLVCVGLRIAMLDTEGNNSERDWLHSGAFTAADIMDRIRWQLAARSGVVTQLRGGIREVLLSPTMTAPINSYEPGLWDERSDERVHRTLSKLQSKLGREAVLWPELGFGRDPGQQQCYAPWGEPMTAKSASGPWPGSLPAPAPGSVFPDPLPVQVLDERGNVVGIDSRGQLSAEPIWLKVPNGSGRSATVSALHAWSGPWPAFENGIAGARAWRFQFVDETGCGWFLACLENRWWARARYD